jgi:hypothetical protein
MPYPLTVTETVMAGFYSKTRAPQIYELQTTINIESTPTWAPISTTPSSTSTEDVISTGAVVSQIPDGQIQAPTDARQIADEEVSKSVLPTTATIFPTTSLYKQATNRATIVEIWNIWAVVAVRMSFLFCLFL